MSALQMVFAAVSAFLLFAVPAQSHEPAVFAASTEEVSVDVFVSHGGDAARNLRADDFEVRDNGRPQTLELVTSEAPALHVVLLLDRSQSMAGKRLAQLKAAAHAFLSGLEARDRVTLLVFDYQVSLQASAASPAEAAARLDALDARGPTALRDALYTAIQAASPEQGRPVVVLFTDGIDAVSWLGEPELLASAKRSEASVYAVLEAAANAGMLQAICDQTGGRVLDGAPGPRLDAAFASILGEVKHRYVLRFTPDDRSDGWHALDVRLKRGHGMQVRARRGYQRSAMVSE